MNIKRHFFISALLLLAILLGYLLMYQPHVFDPLIRLKRATNEGEIPNEKLIPNALPLVRPAPHFLTSEEEQWLDAHNGRIVMTPAPDWEPMEFFDENGRYNGLVADYIHLIEEKLDFKFKIVRFDSWEEILELAVQGKVDVISAAQPTPDRERFMDWTPAYITLKNTIIVRTSLTGELSLDQMQGMRIGVPRKYAVGEYIAQNYPELHLIEVENGREGMKKVSFGELDAMIMEIPNALYVIEQQKITNLRLAGETGFELHLSIGVRKDLTILSTIMEKTLENIGAGERKRIHGKWITLHPYRFYHSRGFWYVIIAISLGVVIITATVLIWNHTLKKEVIRQTLALSQNEKQFRDLVENSPNGISIIHNGKFIYNNPKQLEIMDQLTPLQSGELDQIHEQDREKLGLFLEGLRSGSPKMTEIDFSFEIPSTPDGYQSTESPQDGSTVDSSTVIRWVNCKVSPILYREKEALLLTTIDMTRAKELEHLLIVQEKMVSLGHVAAGIAHEIRNPLSGINIYLRALSKAHKKGNQERIAHTIGEIKAASSKIEGVIKRVMDFSKPSEPHFARININRPILDAIQLSRLTLNNKNITITGALGADIPLCRAEPQLIEEVILNLINNAADAMKKIQNPMEIRVTSTVADNAIQIGVQDSGPGIPPDLRKKVLEPFFTTKNYSTGIGLSLCHRIIRDHGGTIDIRSSRLGGAGFVITIPLDLQLDEHRP